MDGERSVEVGDELSVTALSGLMLNPSTGAAGSFVYKVDDGRGGTVSSTVHLRRPVDGELLTANAMPGNQIERGVSETALKEPSEPAVADASPPPAEPTPTEGDITIAMLETITGSNIRKHPAATAAWIAAVPGGSQLKVVSKDEGVDWYEIETLEGKKGFISARLVPPCRGTGLTSTSAPPRR